MSAYKPCYKLPFNETCAMVLVFLFFAALILAPLHPNGITSKIVSFVGFIVVGVTTGMFHAFLKDEGGGHTKFELHYFISLIFIASIGVISCLGISFYSGSLALDGLIILCSLLPMFYLQWLPLRWGREFVECMKSFMFGDICESKLMVSENGGDVSSFGDVLSSGGFMVGYQLFNVVYGLSWIRFSTILAFV